jgi:outer membrane protein assembly factor BamB
VNASGYVNSETVPIVVGDTVFAGSTDTQLYAINLRTGAVRWRSAPIGGSIGSIGLCSNRVVVIPMGGGDPFTVNRATHDVSRARLLNGGDLLLSSPTVVADVAYVKGAQGIYAFSCQ